MHKLHPVFSITTLDRLPVMRVVNQRVGMYVIFVHSAEFPSIADISLHRVSAV